MSRSASLLGSCSKHPWRLLSPQIRYSAPSLQCLNSPSKRRFCTERQTPSFPPQPFRCCRRIHTSPESRVSRPPQSHDRGPRSEESTQTDFGELNVFSKVPPPASSIDSCTADGFELTNGVKIENAGVLLVGGEVFSWKPWPKSKEEGGRGSFLNRMGQWEVGSDTLGMLGLVWPRPDLLMIGTGLSIAPLSPATRRLINEMGIRVEALDTRNAAAQYNLLATERGVHEIAAALIPVGWKNRETRNF